MLFYWYQEDFFDGTKLKKGGSSASSAWAEQNEAAEKLDSDISLGWLTPEQQKKIADLNLRNNYYEIRYAYDWTPNPKLPL